MHLEHEHTKNSMTVTIKNKTLRPPPDKGTFTILNAECSMNAECWMLNAQCSIYSVCISIRYFEIHVPPPNSILPISYLVLTGFSSSDRICGVGFYMLIVWHYDSGVSSCEVVLYRTYLPLLKSGNSWWSLGIGRMRRGEERLVCITWGRRYGLILYCHTV